MKERKHWTGVVGKIQESMKALREKKNCPVISLEMEQSDRSSDMEGTQVVLQVWSVSSNFPGDGCRAV